MPAKGFRTERDNIINLKFHKQFVEDTGINISYKDLKRIIVESNKEIANVIVAGDDGFKLPANLGVIVASKYKSDKKMIDWKNSNLLKKRVYHLNLHTFGYNFDIRWFKFDVRQLAFSKVFKFTSCRSLSRAVSAFGKETNGSKYHEWKYSDFYNSTRLDKYLLKRSKRYK